MDFTPTNEQLALQGAVREMASRLAPKDAGGDVPTGPQPLDRAGWRAVAEMGLLGLPFSEEHGGFGASAVEVALAASELGAARVALPYADALAAAAALAAGGQGGELAGVISGERVVLTALGEAGAVWAPDQPSRTASPGGSGDGGSGDGVTLSGSAVAAMDLSDADAVVTTAMAGDELGVYLVTSPSVDGAAVTFEAASAVRLGGREVLDAALDLGLVALCGEALGAMGAALTMTTEYLTTRKQFGVALMRFQALTQRAADMYVSVELTRSAVLFAAMTMADDDVPADERSATASRAKYLVGTYGRHVGQEAIQLHGGIGMTAEYAVGHYTSRLAAIERTFGDTRYHLARLAGEVARHESVDVI